MWYQTCRRHWQWSIGCILFLSFTCLTSISFPGSVLILMKHLWLLYNGDAPSLHFPAAVTALCVCVCLSITASVSECVLLSVVPSPPESGELMPTLWQYRDGGAGLSRIDVSWRRFVVAHPCTLGTIKLKIIGSESPPFIDPLESVNSLRHQRQRIQRQRKKCTHTHSLSHTDTHKQRAGEGRVCKRKGKEKGRHKRV